MGVSGASRPLRAWEELGMSRRMRWPALAVVALAALFLTAPTQARAQDYNMGRMFYYPYRYFPHSYWPVMSPAWPERPGEPYMRPPAYMAYLAFHEPYCRYDMHKPMKYYRGTHFWLYAF